MVMIVCNPTEFWKQPKTVHNFYQKFMTKLVITMFYLADLRALEVLMTDSASAVTLSGGVN